MIENFISDTTKVEKNRLEISLISLDFKFNLEENFCVGFLLNLINFPGKSTARKMLSKFFPLFNQDKDCKGRQK
jgi:hypothetical protein